MSDFVWVQRDIGGTLTWVKKYPTGGVQVKSLNMNPAKLIKLTPKRPIGAKGGYFGKKIRKPQKK